MGTSFFGRTHFHVGAGTRCKAKFGGTMGSTHEPKDVRGDFGRRVAQRRAELGLTREEIGLQAGMDPGYVDYLEEHPPSLTRSSLYRLAKALRTSPEELQGAETEVPPQSAVTSVPRRLEVLSHKECTDLVSPGGIGRVAFTPTDMAAPLVLPVNFAWVHESVEFRTVSDGMIARHVPGAATFEVDRIDDTMGEGWSVLVIGTAHVLDDESQTAELDAVTPIMTWADGIRQTYVRIFATHVSGRRIRTLRWGEEGTAQDR